LLQDIAYLKYVNDVPTSLHKNKKGLWPPFHLSTRVCKIENFKEAKDEVGVLASFKFKEVPFEEMNPRGNLMNTYSGLDLYGVILIKIYFLGN
jgi:hypothetical protein